MKYAVIGLGFIYPRHKQAIEDTGGEVFLTCDTDPAKNPDFTDWLEMYHDPRFEEVDAVVICTPNYLHGAMTREAIVRGKKVICEKPFSIESLELDLDPKHYKDVTPVLQLRYHPALQGLKAKSVYVEAKMFRDDVYWNSWKGNPVKSGGVLYNLGVHYIDLLTLLLGKPENVTEAVVTNRMAFGEIMFENGEGRFKIEIVDDRKDQGRKIIVDGKEICLSNQDNLSYEDLHKEVYKDFMMGKGFSVEQAEVSLDLIKDILEWSSGSAQTA